MTKSPRTTEQRMIETGELAARFLADGNEAAEKGDLVKAEKLYAKSQYWHDRYNKLAGND